VEAGCTATTYATALRDGAWEEEVTEEEGEGGGGIDRTIRRARLWSFIIRKNGEKSGMRWKATVMRWRSR
jgi:hypothetical protein